MSRLVRFAGALVVLVIWSSVAPAGPSRHPNVLFIVADDLGWRDLGCFGSTFYETPNIDKLAARGMKFTSAYAAPVCSPTRASILTGKYPQRTRVTDYISVRKVPGPYVTKKEGYQTPLTSDRLALEEFTLAEALKQGGYATFFAGKWHLGPEGFWPENQGFDINKGGWTSGHPSGGKHYFSPYGNPRLKDGPEGEHLDDRLARETIAFIEQHVGESADAKQPFLAYLSMYSPHTPLMARDELVEKYRKKAERLGITESKFIPEGKQKVRANQNHPVYAAMIESMDSAIGKVLDSLDRLKLADNTIVVFVSDNGGVSTAEGFPTSNLPLRGGKGWMYEGGVRVPAIVAWTGKIAAGTVCGEAVSSTDWYPTLLEMTGLPAQVEQHVDGVSFAKLLRREASSVNRPPIFWHYPNFGNQKGFPAGAVRDGDFKLVENYLTGKTELYDLKNDIGETKDLSQEQPEKAKQLRDELKRWQRDLGAQFPSKLDS